MVNEGAFKIFLSLILSRCILIDCFIVISVCVSFCFNRIKTPFNPMCGDPYF